MRMRLRCGGCVISAFIIGVLIVGLAGEGAAADPVYSLTNLGDLPGGGIESRAADINEAGDVVGAGWADAGGAFLWTGESMSNLGGLPNGYSSAAHGINSSNHVVGTASTDGGGASRAFSWDATNSMTQLGSLPEESFSAAYGINDAGIIVGESRRTGPSETRAVMWVGGSATNIGTLGGSAVATDVNNSGQIVGRSQIAGAVGHAFIYDGVMHDLGTPPGEQTSYASSINNSGHVAGWSENVTSGPSARYHAMFYDGSIMLDVGVLPGMVHAQANDLNDSDQLVGWSSISTDGGDGHLRRAFLYDVDDALMRDLNSLVDASAAGWTLLEATAINNAQQIVGYGLYDSDGPVGNDPVVLGFLLTPVPEPAAIALSACAFLLWRPNRAHR